MINKEKAYSYFDNNHGPLKRSTNGWFEGVCPFCGRKKLAVNFDYMLVKCWRGCFRNSFIIDFIMKIEGMSYFEAITMLEHQNKTTYIINNIQSNYKYSDVELPYGYRSILYDKDSIIGSRACNYLLQRGFDLDYLDRIGVGYCDEEHDKPELNFFGYIIIPFKRKGKLVYYTGRDFMGSSLRYKNPPKSQYGVGKNEVMFNEEALQLFDKVYITEGWADAATIGNNGVSINGVYASKDQISTIITSPAEEIIIAFDNGFMKESYDLAFELLDYKKVKVLDMSKLGKKDVNEAGKDSVLQLELNTDFSCYSDVLTGIWNET